MDKFVTRHPKMEFGDGNHDKVVRYGLRLLPI